MSDSSPSPADPQSQRHLPIGAHGAPALRTIAMPADANPNGDIFGGWLLGRMDLAGGTVAFERACGRVVTVAIDALTFLAPVAVGDLVSCYAQVTSVGRTSMQVRIETTVRRQVTHESVRVTEGLFTYVAVDPAGRPRPIPPAPC